MDFIRRYSHPKVIAILLLGFSSGLPRLLVASTLGAWLADSGVEKAAIGLFAYVALPYSFNFVWAPLIDHMRLPILTSLLGQRRGWMILSQFGLIISLLVMSGLDASVSPISVAICALFVAFFSASQDVVIDAYRTEFLDSDMYGEGAAMAVFGYRVGMLVAGAGALALADIPAIGWSHTYEVMALLVLVGVVTVMVTGEPIVNRTDIAANDIGIVGWLRHAIVSPFHNFVVRHHRWAALLLFIALYRMSDGFIGFMATPFMMDIGFSKTQIAAIGKLYGFGATIVGTFLGGALLHRLGMYRSLMLFGFLQLFTNLTYILLAYVGSEEWALMLAISCDNLAGGMVTAAAIAFMMRLCHSDYTATQYALLSSLASLAAITLSGAAGVIAQSYGWVVMFSVSGLLGIPALFVLYYIRRHPIFVSLRD